MHALLAEPASSYAEVSVRLGMPIGSIGPIRGQCLYPASAPPGFARACRAGRVITAAGERAITDGCERGPTNMTSAHPTRGPLPRTGLNREGGADASPPPAVPTTEPQALGSSHPRTNLPGLFRHFPLEAWAILVVAVAMLVIGLVGADGKSEGIWFELARAGVGVFAVAFLGGGAAASFREREIERENARRQDEYRGEFVSELWDAYHEIKSVRRALKAVGVRRAAPELTPEQAGALQRQMPRLDAAQLTLEKLFRTVRRERDAFCPYDQRLLFLLRTAENYAKKVLDDWERHKSKHLPRFLGTAKGPGGVKDLSIAVEQAANLVYALRSDSTIEHAELEVDCDLRTDKPLHDDDDDA
jgi:hypothetical protein